MLPSIHRLKRKWLLLALLPFIGATAMIAIAVVLQANELSEAEQRVVATAYNASKQAELENYMALADSAIAPLYDSGRDDDATRERVLAELAKLGYGDDGYFFVYDTHGIALMHPRQPDLIGKNLWGMHDPDGTPVIQALIRQAQQGGGFVEYLWPRPSTHQMERKLAYVKMYPRWGWVIGTGMYLDDVKAALAQTDRQASANIRRTLLWIGVIGAFGMIVIGACGLALNITDQRSSDAQLKLLARQVVESQEAERGRLSRELHDGISQMLVSTKLLLESVLARPIQPAVEPDALRQPIQNALAQTNRTLGEIRRISHDLRPTMLDDLGLGAALRQLARESSSSAVAGAHANPGSSTGPGVRITVDAPTTSGPQSLPDAVNTALFRVAQEALTNIACHARARNASLQLSVWTRQVMLKISDDGVGFDDGAVQADPRRGIGLRNMRERIESLDGTFHIESRPGHTELVAVIPLRAASANGAAGQPLSAVSSE
jgi:two-component system NarL family sensor kinase